MVIFSSPSKCWNCDHPNLTNHFQMNSFEMRETRIPVPGDITICGRCGEFSIFDGFMRLTEPDSVMMEKIHNTEALIDMQDRLIKRKKD